MSLPSITPKTVTVQWPPVQDGQPTPTTKRLWSFRARGVKASEQAKWPGIPELLNGGRPEAVDLDDVLAVLSAHLLAVAGHRIDARPNEVAEWLDAEFAAIELVTVYFEYAKALALPDQDEPSSSERCGGASASTPESAPPAATSGSASGTTAHGFQPTMYRVDDDALSTGPHG